MIGDDEKRTKLCLS